MDAQRKNSSNSPARPAVIDVGRVEVGGGDCTLGYYAAIGIMYKVWGNPTMYVVLSMLSSLPEVL